MGSRNILAIALILLSSAEARAFSPQVEALGGSGRSGLAKEGMFSNPASVALLSSNVIFAVHNMSRLPDLDAGGKAQAIGMYDGSSDFAHGGLAYVREARRIGIGATTTYAQHQTIRGVMGRPVVGGLLMGAKVDYTIRRENSVESKYFHGDVGFIYPLFSDLPLGLTVENVLDKQGERPRTAFLAGRYYVMGPLDLYADYGYVISKVKSADEVWGLGVEMAPFDQIMVRGGLFQDSVLDTRGWALGLAWNSPRASFEYALRTTTNRPRQRDHVFGISVQL